MIENSIFCIRTTLKILNNVYIDEDRLKTTIDFTIY